MTAETNLPELFVHVKRPEWGLALVTANGTKHTEYLFQDGRRRSFADGFLELLQPADEPIDLLRRVAAELQASLGRGVATDSRGAKRLTLDNQIKIFRALFPAGFVDPKYRAYHRGREVGRRHKRHLDAASNECRTRLSAERLDALIESRDYHGVQAEALATLRCCALCTANNLKSLVALPESRSKRFAEALREVLHGAEEVPYATRFTRLLASVAHPGGDPLSWPAATALPALMHPEQHVPVNRQRFDRQAKWSAPHLIIDRAPTAYVYERLLRVTTRLKEDLAKAELQPHDLLDVHTFIVETLRPSHLRLLDPPA